VTTFAPSLGMSLSIGPNTYQFVPHPHFPDDEVFVVEGGEALLYQLQDTVQGYRYALKVMKPVYRSQQCVRTALALQPYKHIPGLFLANRLCLTKTLYPALIATYPDLEYATLMPWLSGRSWAGLLLDSRSGAQYTPVMAYRLATTLANILQHLETLHFAHTDIAGSNVIISPNFERVELLDIEGLYITGSRPPAWHSQGSPGYQHRKLDQRGQSRPEGDRFAAAILLTEMLTWWNPLVRALTTDDAESLFTPETLQTPGTPLWKAVRDTLWTMNPDLLYLFDQAWTSADLAQCPELKAWAIALSSASNL
jgi:serine/threonine protein kinase